MKTCLFRQILGGSESENKPGLSWSFLHHRSNLLKNALLWHHYECKSRAFSIYHSCTVRLWWHMTNTLTPDHSLLSTLPGYNMYEKRTYASSSMSDVFLDVRTVWNQLVGVGLVAEKLRPPERWPLVRGKIRFSTSGGSVKWWVAGILGAIWNDLKADVLPTEFGKSKAWQIRSCWWHLSQNHVSIIPHVIYVCVSVCVCVIRMNRDGRCLT